LFEQVRHLAISDPMTGLVNYRRLLDVLEHETERTNRNGRPFSILLLDLDGLKKINDTHGHVIGSEAICRVGNVLRGTCRSIDVAARYGGDEFALVLPETGMAEARRVASRIRKTLLEDTQEPRLSASIGISVYEGHGERIEKLLSAADSELYAEKTRQKGRGGAPVSPLRRPYKV
jgi:diguanylate cyclase (GGDEF)-like protein